jgi:hypothetical protein
MDEELEETLDEEKKIFYRKMIRQCLILSGFLAAFFVLLLLSTVLSRSSWKNGLRKEIQEVFAENLIDAEISSWIKIKSVFTTQASVYSLTKKNPSDAENFAVIARIPTLYGPVAAVFLWSSADENAKFLGLSHTDFSMAQKIESASLNSQIASWEKRIPKFIRSAR